MKFSRLLLGIIIVVVLLVMGAAGYYLFQRNISGSTQKNSTSTKEYLFTTGEITANLNDPQNRSYIKINIYLGYNSQKLGTELTDKTPQIRDAMLNILRSKKASDLNSQQSIDKMKTELIDKINSILTTGKVSSVYFSDILIQ